MRLPYRIDEAIAVARASGANALMCVEGEKATEIYRGVLGLACVTLNSFSKDEVALLAQMTKNTGLGIVYHPDHDQAGTNKADKIQEACAHAGVFCFVLDPVAIYPNLPESGDIAELLAVMGASEFVEQLEVETHRAVKARRNEPQRENKLMSI